MTIDFANIAFTEYRAEYGFELVKMWRRSFQKAMSLEEHNRLDELYGQLKYFSAIDPATISIALDKSTSVIASFMVLSQGMLDHLYVAVEYQGYGIGSHFLNQAKAQSPNGLELFTFQKNHGAQSFYLSHGFHEVHRGHADSADNPWATSAEDLADIKYRWEPEETADSYKMNQTHHAD